MNRLLSFVLLAVALSGCAGKAGLTIPAADMDVGSAGSVGVQYQHLSDRSIRAVSKIEAVEVWRSIGMK